MRPWPLLLPLLLLSGAALARPGVPDAAAPPRPAAKPVSREAVNQLVSSGVLALATRDFPAAYRAFASAYRLAPGPDILYQLGIVAWAEGRSVPAHDLLRRYLAEASAAPAAKRAEAQRILEQPAGDSGEARLSGEAGAAVLLDERLVGIAPLPLPLLLAAGPHKLVVETATGRRTAALQVQAGRTLVVRPGPAPDALQVSELAAVLVLAAGAVPKGKELSALLERAGLAELPESALMRPVAASCWEQRSCLLALGEPSGVELILHLEGGATQLALQLFDVAAGAVAAERSVAAGGDAGAQWAELLATLPALCEQARRRGRGQLQVRAEPPGAAVELAGWQLGTAPLSRASFAGEHELLLRAPGHLPARQRVRVEAGQTATVNVRLLPEAPRQSDVNMVWQRAPRPRWRLALGGVVAAGGVVVLGLGAAALAVDGSCIDPPEAPVQACPRQYDTRSVGGGLLATGLLLGAGGALLLALPGPRRRVEVPAAAATEAAR